MSVETNTLESMCELIVDCPHSTPKWTDEGIIVLRNQNIKNGSLNLSAPSFTNEEGYQKRIKRAVPQAGDIVFTREAPMGEVCIIPEGVQCCLGQRQVLLRPKKDISGEYLFWALQSPFVKHQISWNEGTGSTVSNVRIPVLKSLKIPRLRGREERIAEVLSILAKKIELNRQTNQTLEQITQALFKSWFVDFEPTRAKIAAKQAGQDPERAAMAAISGKTVAELDQLDAAQLAQLKTTAALFPDGLVESELGEVPEGWDEKPLYETADYVNGSAFKTKDFSENQEGLPIVKIVELKNGITQGTKFTTGQFKEKYSITSGDILYSWSGSPETSLEVFKWFGGDAWLNQHIFKLNFASQAQKHFAFYLLRHMKPTLISTAKQKQTTGLGHITVADMKRLKVAYPNNELLEGFSTLVTPIYDKCSSLDKENIELAVIRDTLLPKLLSGELSPTKTEAA